MAYQFRRRRPILETLTLRLNDVLDDGSGQTRPELVPLRDFLLAVPKPGRVLVWLRNNPRAADYLHALAVGQIPLSHDALHDLPSPKTVSHLRDLLVTTAVLPAIDRQIALYESWARAQLIDAAHTLDPAAVRLLRQFHTWHLLPQLHTRAARAPVSAGSRHHAASAFTEAARMLAWITAQGLTPGDLRQGHLDSWLVEHPARFGTTFLRWSISSGHIPPLQIPTMRHRARPAISQQERLDWIRRALTDDTLDLRDRVAAGLVLLTAQPLVRVVALTLDDVVIDTAPASTSSGGGGSVTLRLGTPPTPIPEPLSDLLVTLTRQRTMLSTTNSTSRWLFPGQSPGHHLTAGRMRQRFQALGLPTTPARIAGLNQLVLQAPAPVIATAFGYHAGTAETARENAGAPWSRYTGTPR